MTGPASHNRPARRRRLLSLAAAAVLLASLGIAVLVFPHTELGRTLVAHLGQLAEPRAWIP